MENEERKETIYMAMELVQRLLLKEENFDIYAKNDEKAYILEKAQRFLSYSKECVKCFFETNQ